MTIESGTSYERYDLSRFHPDARKPLMEIAEEALYSFLPSIETASLSRFFNVPTASITEDHIAYMRRYVSIVVPQLVIGAYSAPDYDITKTSRDNQLDAIRKRGTTLFRVADLWHELAHTVVALGKSKHSDRVESATPHFQLFPQRKPKHMTDEEFETMQQADHAEEVAAGVWEYLSPRRTLLLRLIHDAKKNFPGNVTSQEEDFIKKFGAAIKRDMVNPASMDAYTRRLMSRVFHEYQENTLLPIQLFMEATGPLMKKHGVT